MAVRVKKVVKEEVATETVDTSSIAYDETFSRIGLRRKVKFHYDIQNLRMAASARSAKKSPGAEAQLHPTDVKALEERAGELLVLEKRSLKTLEEHLSTIPFYRDVILKDRVKYKGLGPTLAAVLLAEVDIYRANTVSSLWKYAGLAPVPAMRCKHCFTLVKEDDGGYKHSMKTECKLTSLSGDDVINSGRSERPTKGQKIGYNPFLKTKLLGVLSGVMLKVGSPYRKHYDNYKQRWISAGRGVSDLHRHNAALRYMIKMFLLDFYNDWRNYLHLPVRETYQEQYLGHKHHEKPAVANDVVQVQERIDFNGMEIDELVEGMKD